MKKSRIAITMGDPAGIGPEIVVKALNNKELQERGILLVVGDKSTLEQALKITNIDLEINIIKTWDERNYKVEAINLIELGNVDIKDLKIGEVQGTAGRASYDYIVKATEMALAGEVDAIATAPINKKSLQAGNVDFIGHTEILAALTNVEDPLTMFQVHNLRVFFLTRHLSLRQACEMVTKRRVLVYIQRSVETLKKLGIKAPKLAVAGLNPHSGEQGLFGDEEVKEIYPAIEDARNIGIDVEGPIPADSVFYKALKGEYDAVLSLYHDQGHIATKMVDFERTISITNNMPFLRTSVDHGTAFDLAGTGRASSVSMEEAIKLAIEYASVLKE